MLYSNMSLHIVSKNNIISNDLTNFVSTIYMNFEHLTQFPNLKHTKKDIESTLKSENSQIYLIIVNNKIGAYLIGNILTLDDGRKVLFVAYLFTSKLFRRRGFATKLMELVENKAKLYNLDGVMLMCDTENQKVYDFYLSRGYMSDLILRNYSRFEVLTKVV